MAVLLMPDWTERSFDLVSDLTKQVLILSTATIALSVTFLTDVASNAGRAARVVLAASWIAFLIAVVLGLMTLMAATGVQRNAAAEGATSPTIDAGNLRILGGGQLLTFGIGLVLLLVRRGRSNLTVRVGTLAYAGGAFGAS